MLGFVFVFVAARRCRRSIRGCGTGVGGVLVVATGATVTAGQLQGLALYVVLGDATVLVVESVALDLRRQVILHHREIGRRRVVVVQRRRQSPQPLRRVLVRIGRSQLVPANLPAPKQLLDGRRGRSRRRRRRATPRETLVGQLIMRW